MLSASLSQKYWFGVRSLKLVSLRSSLGLLRFNLSMLTFITPNVCPKWSNLSKSTTKKTNQSFGPICHRAIMQIKRENGWRLEQKNIKIVPKTDNLPNVPHARPIGNCWALLARAVYAKRWATKNETEIN
jgi:hypothetical protein